MDTPTGRPSDYQAGYACFLAGGLLSLLVAALNRIPMDTGTAGGIGLLVLVPLFLFTVPAMAVGMGLAVKLRDDPWLVGVALLTALYVVQFFGELLPAPLQKLAAPLYGVVVTAVAIRGLLRSRRPT